MRLDVVAVKNSLFTKSPSSIVDLFWLFFLMILLSSVDHRLTSAPMELQRTDRYINAQGAPRITDESDATSIHCARFAWKAGSCGNSCVAEFARA